MRAVLASSLLLCGLLSVRGGAAAPAEALPRSPACHAALQALEQAEDAIAATAAASAPQPQRQHEVAARLRPLRQRVADACLGGLTTSPPPSQHTWSAPTLPARPGVTRPSLPAAPAVTVPLPRFEPPVTVTHCNAAACFTSEGSTLIRLGPTLVGPRGSCTVQGSFVRCP
ncbi:MAG: hypothetical protein GXC94_18470 [Comamonadaceae bacterium]|jgi:hypothetical protein|nr:hypothetical protein [Comamonadaceae bacterium]